MKNALWFLLGIIGGFVAAHLMNKDPRGQVLLADVDARISEFTDRIGDAYREQDARFSALVDDVKDAAADAYGAAREAASSAVDAAKSASTDAVESAADAASEAVDEVTDSAGRPND